MRFLRDLSLSAIAAVATMLTAHPANAQSPAQFYAGKTVTLLVGAAAGTPSDFMARQFAPYFAKNIPGQPNVIVMNVAGAGGMVAAGQLQTKAPRDGTTIAFLQRNNLFRPMVENNHHVFDPREVSWLGSMNKEYHAIVARGTSKIKTIDDVFKTPMPLGATGVANENRILPAIMNEFLGAKFEIVHGYSGREEAYLAIERGEVDGWLPTLNGLTYGVPAAQIKEGKLKVLMLMDWRDDPRFPGVPNLSGYVKDPKAKALIDFFVLPSDAGRPLAVPRGVPVDRMEALRAAFMKTTNDADFINHMKAQQVDLEPIGHKEIEDILKGLYATPPDVLARAKAFLTAK